MAAGIWRLPSSLEETVAQLDQLSQAEEARRAKARLSLDSAVAALNGGGGSSADDDSLNDGRPAVRAVGRPFVALPQRTTHGGPWGPAVAAKLRAEALGRRGW